MSGLPTEGQNIEQIVNWSYFEKVERLKKKIIQTHKTIELKHLDGYFKRLVDDGNKVLPYGNM